MLLGTSFGLVVPIAAASSGPAETWPNGFRYVLRRILAGALHGMPDGGEGWVFFRAQADALRSVAEGGHVEDGDFRDLRFETASGQLIRAEVESYDPATGTVTAWLYLAGFRAGVDYQVLLYYGRSDLAVGQSDPAGCWNGWLINARLSDGLDQTGHERHLALTSITPTTLLGAAAGDFG